MNRDEITVTLFQHINVDELVAAKREGNLLSYLSKIAERIVGPATQNDWRAVRREDVRETVSNPIPPTPQPTRLERIGDSIRVAQL